MKTCLGSLLLLPTLAALIITAIYHTSVNAELRFEQRDSNEEFINTRRSYRPQIRRDTPTQNAPSPNGSTRGAAPRNGQESALPALRDDDIAEEADA